jgi:hypothetical protein
MLRGFHPMKKIFPLLAFTLLLAACAGLSAQKEPGADPTRFKKIFVEHRLADDRGIDQLIVRELQRLGYRAACGPLTITPDDTEVIVAYDDQWNWDFTLYLIDLTVQARDAHTGKILATAHVHHPMLGNKPPAEMVQAAIDPLFQRR